MTVRTQWMSLVVTGYFYFLLKYMFSCRFLSLLSQQSTETQ